MKTKITVTLLLLMTVLNCNAIKYQIKCLNTPTININNKKLKTGDWFNDNAVIYWENDTQAMRVLSENNKMYTFSAKRYKQSKSKKFSDFIAYTKPMASRGMHSLKKNLQAIFENEFEILDELQIDLSEVEDLPADITFIISKKDELGPTLSLKPENGTLTLTREDLESFSLEGETIPLTVTILYRESQKTIVITRWFEVIML